MKNRREKQHNGKHCGGKYISVKNDELFSFALFLGRGGVAVVGGTQVMAPHLGNNRGLNHEE